MLVALNIKSLEFPRVLKTVRDYIPVRLQEGRLQSVFRLFPLLNSFCVRILKVAARDVNFTYVQEGRMLSSQNLQLRSTLSCPRVGGRAS